MSKKVKVTLSIDGEVIKKAKQIGLNISQFCENALKEALLKLNSVENSQKSEKERFSLSKGSLFGKRESLVDGTGFEPAASTQPSFPVKNLDQENSFYSINSTLCVYVCIFMYVKLYNICVCLCMNE